MDYNALLQRIAKLEKAAVNQAVGGQLLPAQARRFVDLVKKENMLHQEVTTVPMVSDTYSMDLIDIAEEQTVEDQEGIDNGNTADATMPRRTMNLKKIKWKFDLTLHWVQYNAAGPNGQRAVEQSFAKAFGNDQAKLGVNGDEASGNAFLALNDGWVRKSLDDAGTHIYVNSGNTDYYGTVFPAMIDALPEKWRDPSKVRFNVSASTFTAYLRQLKTAGFRVSDDAIKGQAASFEGYTVKQVRYWPTDYPMLTFPKNLHLGLKVNGFRYDVQWQARKGVWEYTIRTAADYDFAIADSLVIGNLA